MAKPAKPRKAPTVNPRSRASKPATSPSIDVDKSIKHAPRASDATPILGPRPNSGISKAKKKQKTLTRGQRRRQERGVARAEVVQDQMNRKSADAAGRLKKIRERKGMWDEVNGSTNKFDKLKSLVAEEEDENEQDEWEDMEEVEDDKAPTKSSGSAPAAADTDLFVVDRTAMAPVPITTTTNPTDETDLIT